MHDYLNVKQSQFCLIHIHPNWLRSRSANTLSKMWPYSCQWKISLQWKWPSVFVNVNAGVETSCSHTIIFRVLGMKCAEWQHNWEVVCLSDLPGTRLISVFSTDGSTGVALSLSCPSSAQYNAQFTQSLNKTAGFTKGLTINFNIIQEQRF
jgi:hypothetical protein